MIKMIYFAVFVFTFAACHNNKSKVLHSRYDTRDSFGAGGIWFVTDSIVGKDTFRTMVDSQTNVSLQIHIQKK